MHKKLECLLVSTTNGEPYDEYLELATAFYKGDFDRSLLSTQLQNLVCRKERESVSQRVCSIPQGSTYHRHKSHFSAKYALLLT